MMIPPSGSFIAFPFSFDRDWRWKVALPTAFLIASVKYQHQYEGKRLDEVAAMMDLPVEEAVSRLGNGSLSEVVSTQFGHHLIKKTGQR